MTREWQPLYLAYCNAQGRTPDDQIAFDRKTYPGGSMTGYINWRRDALRVYAGKIPGDPSDCSGVLLRKFDKIY